MLVKLLLYFMHLGALMLIVLQTSVDVWDAKKFPCPQKCRNSLALNFTRTLLGLVSIYTVSLAKGSAFFKKKKPKQQNLE